MALTDDQKAMLRLLAQRETGYEDMASLMGIGVDELRDRVKEALAEVDEQTATKKAARRPRLSLPNLPANRGAAIGVGAGLLVLVVLAIILVLGGDGGSDSSTTAAGGNQGGTTPTAAEERNLTQAILSPVDGGEASGRALFGRYKKNVLLQVEAEGLEPSPQGESYTVWLFRSPRVALQIGTVQVGDSGKIAAQFQVPAQLLAYVANGAFDRVDVSLTSIADYKAAFNKAKSENRVPPYTGKSVLRGEITGPAVQPQQ